MHRIEEYCIAPPLASRIIPWRHCKYKQIINNLKKSSLEMQCIFASVLSLNVLCVEAELYIYKLYILCHTPPHIQRPLSLCLSIYELFSLSLAQPVYTRGINPQLYIVLGWVKVEWELNNRWRDLFIKYKMFIEIILDVWCKRKIKKLFGTLKLYGKCWM